MPMQGQFEQALNAFQLERAGYGKNVTELSPETIRDFLDRVPQYAERLAGYQPGDNRAIRAKLDALLDADGALARALHARRA